VDLLRRINRKRNPNQHAPRNPNLINRKRNRKESEDSYLRRPSPSPSMEEWVAREVVTVDGGEGDVGGGEEEWVEWIMEKRSGSSGEEEWVHLSASSVFDILKRVSIENKTNSL